MASFKDFLLKEELIRAIEECGFEKPSPVQNETINYAYIFLFLYIKGSMEEISCARPKQVLEKPLYLY